MDPADPFGAGPDRPSVIFPLLGVARAALRPRSELDHGQDIRQLLNCVAALGVGNRALSFSTPSRSNSVLQAS